MNKLLFLGMGLVTILLILGYTETRRCPESCFDNDPCTTDFCDKTTGYKCKHTDITLCLADGCCPPQL